MRFRNSLLLAALGATVLMIAALRGDMWPRPTAILDPVTAVPAALPVLGTVPDFTLMSESGQEYGIRELTGKVWVATFIFTRCPGTCRGQTTQMCRLQNRWSDRPDRAGLRLVSFSVDPEYD